LRVIFATCVVCFALAIYSGHRIISETHLHLGDEPSMVPGAAKRLHRDSTAMFDDYARRAALSRR
jgi:hypothetical protein